MNYNDHSDTTDFVDNVFTQSFLPLITRPTHFTVDKSRPTLIDNIIANTANGDSISGMLLSDVSDHLPVFLICCNFHQITESTTR